MKHKKHIRLEELGGLKLWAVYHCLSCSKVWSEPLFFVPHFNALKEYVKKEKRC